MTSYKITIAVDEQEMARTLTGALENLIEPSPDALTQFEAGEGWLIEGYYQERPNLAALTRELGAALPFSPPPIGIEEVPDENWVAISQAALPPVSAGRFTVHGSHDLGKVPRGPNTLLIDAGEAFGTAHHATTQGCLLALDELTRRRSFDRVLDLEVERLRERGAEPDEVKALEDDRDNRRERGWSALTGKRDGWQR